jgi:hypothetical protein
MRQAWLTLALLAGCDGATSDPGLSAWLRVDEARYFPSAPPAAAGGPEVLGVQFLATRAAPGLRGRSVQGSLGPTATAVALWLDGDQGHWALQAGAPDPITRVLGFATRLSFSPALPLGDRALLVAAVDPEGRAGPPAARTLQVAQSAVDGRLVVSLSWSADADLDLHVIDPNGVEIWARNVNSYENPRPGTPPDPAEVQKGGVLDYDSNSGCVIDGRNEENVVWRAAPPSGSYVVRVDAPSLCGEPLAPYTVQVVLDGALVGGAIGAATPTDVNRQTHDRGSGTTVLVFDVP